MKKKFFVATFVILFMFMIEGTLKKVKASDDLIGDEDSIQIEEDSTIITPYGSSSGSSGSDSGWYNIGTSLPYAVDYSNSNLLKYLKAGDILYEDTGFHGMTGHMAIVEGIFYDETYNQEYIRLIEAVDVGVTRGVLTPERFTQKEAQVYRLTDVDKMQIAEAVRFCESQLGKEYGTALKKSSLAEKEKWYCSELIWAAYFRQGIYLDADDNDENGSVVWPREIIQYENATLISHYQYPTYCEVIDAHQHKIICNTEIYIEEHDFSEQVSGYTYKCSMCGFQDIIYKIEESVSVGCHTNGASISTYCQEGEYSVIHINVECDKSYQITSTLITKTRLPIQMRLYDSNMNLINDSPELSNNNMTGVLTQYMRKGVYHLRVSYPSDILSGEIETEFSATWLSYGVQLQDNVETVMDNHWHHTEDGDVENMVYYINNTGAGYRKITINVERADGSTMIYPANCFFVKDHMDEEYLFKFNSLNESRQAVNDFNSNSLLVYLSGNGYSHIHIKLPDIEYSSVSITISPITEKLEMDITNRMREEFTETIFLENENIDNVRIIDIDKLGEFIINVEAYSWNNYYLQYVFFKQVYNKETYEYSIIPFICSSLNSTKHSDEHEVTLEPGTYYMGYFGNKKGVEVEMTITRHCLTYVANRQLILDPSADYECGSEVRLNGGAYGARTITEGFTRCIYIDSTSINTTTSRLGYLFYSSNESVATVSIYGTVLAKEVSSDQTVTIYAIDKKRPRLVHSVTLTILDDTSNERKEFHSNITHTYLYEQTGGRFQFKLNESECPYPRFQDYVWNFQITSGDINFTMDNYGYVTVSGPGTIEVVGHYINNPNVYVYITIKVI